MKAIRIRNTFFATVALSLFFILCIATDIFPWLRGPAPFPQSWQWPYAANFSVLKSIIPLGVLFATAGALYFFEKNKLKITVRWLLGFVFLAFFFTLAVLFFGRGGISILLQRIIDLGFSGYFTASTKMQNLHEFLSLYHENMEQYYTHPRAHPPGWILFHGLINAIAALFAPLTIPMLKSIAPSHDSVKEIWIALNPAQQLGALLSTLIIPFLASVIVIPTCFVSQFFTDSKTALRTAVLSGLIPSVILFTPLPDVLFPVSCMTAFYFLLRGLRDEGKEFIFLSGAIISLTLFAGLNVLPFFLFMVLYIYFTNNLSLTVLKPYALGILLIPVFFYIFFGYEYIQVVLQSAVEGKAPRDYWTWLPFNLSDFFIYTGIPICVLFFAETYNYFFKKSKLEQHRKKILYPLLITIILLLLSGFTRGEVGRLWVSLMPLIIIASTGEIKRLSSLQFLGVTFLLGLQVIFMQGYWVSLW